MIRITITWNPDRSDETKVTYSEGFTNADWLTKVDMLKDAIGDLWDVYDSVLEKEKK